MESNPILPDTPSTPADHAENSSGSSPTSANNEQEGYLTNPEIASQPSRASVTNAASAPTAGPQSAVTPLDNPTLRSAGAIPTTKTAGEPIAQNAKSIEDLKKKYVLKAQHILSENASDPHTGAKVIEQIKVNYLRDIYKRDIKLPQE